MKEKKERTIIAVRYLFEFIFDSVLLSKATKIEPLLFKRELIIEWIVVLKRNILIISKDVSLFLRVRELQNQAIHASQEPRLKDNFLYHL